MPSPPLRARAALHDRKQQIVRDEIAAVAIRLFAARGFASVTIADIADAAGVSRRTFFRYFATKEDVVVARIDKFGQDLGRALAARPAAEPPLLAIRRALSPMIDFCMADPQHTTMASRLMCETPALRACHLDKQQRWQAHVAPELARRLRIRSAHDLRPRVLAAAALAAFDVAFHAWAADTRHDLHALVDRAFAAFGIEPPSPPRRRAPAARKRDAPERAS